MLWTLGFGCDSECGMFYKCFLNCNSVNTCVIYCTFYFLFINMKTKLQIYCNKCLDLLYNLLFLKVSFIISRSKCYFALFLNGRNER